VISNGLIWTLLLGSVSLILSFILGNLLGIIGSWRRGGLVDTVFDRDYSDKPAGERNGYVFHEADFAGLESAMYRAIGLWNHHAEEFRQLMCQGMAYDYSWKHPGQDYVNVYEWVRHK
jgi:starch synthase